MSGELLYLHADVRAEAALIGWVLVAAQRCDDDDWLAFDSAYARVQAPAFFLPSHQSICSVMHTLRTTERPVSATNVVHAITDGSSWSEALEVDLDTLLDRIDDAIVEPLDPPLIEETAFVVASLWRHRKQQSVWGPA